MLFRSHRSALPTIALCLAACPTWGQNLAEMRLGDQVVPVAQSIHLKLDADQATYSGSVAVQLDVRRETSLFHFHSEGPELTALRLFRGADEIAASHRPLGDDLVEVATEKPLSPGAHRLEIELTNAFDTKATSLYRAEVEGAGYSFSQFEADDAREAFPCWDEPRFKIPYQVTLTVPAGHLAITNTPPEKEAVADGWRTTAFAESPPMPSYLLAIATGPFDLVDLPGLGVPARIITVKGQSRLTTTAREVTPPILKALEAYFGRPYPYRKLDFIAVPEFWPGAMENPGAITYADRLLIVDPATATIEQRRAQVGIIAHELAHQWFGNLVTMEWWDDLWLNESFADWMGDKIAHQIFPQLGLEIGAVMSGQRIMVSDARDSSRAIRQPVKTTDNLLQDVGLAYAKGNTVLAMFEQWLGPEVFRQGVVDYITAREWKNATAADLFAALAAASGKPVAETFATFTDQPGVPRLSVEPLGGGEVRLRQQRFRYRGSSSPDQQWRIPVMLAYGAESGVEHRSVLLDKPSLVVDLGTEEPTFIHPNAGARGYYRWSVPAADLAALAEHGLRHLEPVERINLVSNVSALLEAGDVDGGTFLSVLTRLAGDAEPMVVSAVMNELGLVETAFVPDPLKAAYASWLRSAFGPALERFGQAKKDGEAETVGLLRPRLLRLLAEQGRDETVVAHFKALAKAYLADPRSVDPALAGSALGALAKDGDAELFESFKARAEAATTPQERSRFLGTLSAFDDETLQQRALGYAFEGPVRPNEIFTVLRGFGGSEQGQDKLFHFVLENWDLLGTKLPVQFRAFVPRLAGGCSQARLQIAEDFFSKPENRGPGVERSMARVRESVASCVALRQRESASVAEFLKTY